MIPFNKPFIIGNELTYIEEAVNSGKISGNGEFTVKCQQFFEQQFGFKKCLLTTSCTDALEMAAILIDVKSGDEVIIPSYTFVSTANAFVLRGAKVVFADSEEETPNMDAAKVEELITDKTKAIIVMHYGGVACDMDAVMKIAEKHNLFVIEDAAQAIDSYYKGKPLGAIGHLGTFSFHETKNLISGEGGMLVINDDRFVKRAEIVWEKGTDRAAFFRGEVDKYGWVDIGSSYLPSELTAAFLFAQFENLELIQRKRLQIWNAYNNGLMKLEENGLAKTPYIPDYATNNAHLYYLVCNSADERNRLLNHLKENGIHAVFHYLSLHKSSYYKDEHLGSDLPLADRYSDCLLRLPLFYELNDKDTAFIIEQVLRFYGL